MSLSKKLDRWKEQQFITQEQYNKILDFERTRSNSNFWRMAFIFAGLLIGLGVCLLVASNWNALGHTVKLVGDFILLGGCSYMVYWSMAQKHTGLRELFIILSFLLIGASIGLIGQVFQLDGGWRSAAVLWATLALVYVWASRVLFVGVTWWILFLSGLLQWNWLEQILEHIMDQLDSSALGLIAGLWALSFVGNKFNEKWGNYTRLAAAFEKVMMWLVYASVTFVGLRWGLTHWGDPFLSQCFAHLIVFAFLGVRMYQAVQTQNQSSFKRNAVLAEIYVFGIFASRFGNLFVSGLGFILGGLFVIGFIYVLRKTTRYIRKMEAFQ